MAQNVMNGKGVDIGKRIKSARVEEGHTIAWLAQQLGVDQRTVAGWQSGRSKPSLERLIEIARLLNRPPSYFLEEAPS